MTTRETRCPHGGDLRVESVPMGATFAWAERAWWDRGSHLVEDLLAWVVNRVVFRGAWAVRVVEVRDNRERLVSEQRFPGRGDAEEAVDLVARSCESRCPVSAHA